MTEKLPAQRRARILDLLDRDGHVRVPTLATELGVSEMTVRRDITALADAGELVKVHGGAAAEDRPTSGEPGFDAQVQRAVEAKNAIARLAAELVRPGMSLALGAGTTTFALAHKLARVPELTIVTNSPRLAAVAEQSPDPHRTVLLTGGMRTPSDALVGPLATGALATLRVDLAVLGAHGLTAEAGCTTPNILEAAVNSAILASAARTAVLIDSGKWGVTGLCRFAALDDIDILLSDDALPLGAQRALAEHIDDIRLAPRGGSTPERNTP